MQQKRNTIKFETIIKKLNESIDNRDNREKIKRLGY